jgi:hypothetical protein
VIKIRWEDIVNLSFGLISLELKIEGYKKNIKAHSHLIGFDKLVSKIEEKTGKTRAQMGLPN